MKKLLIGLTLLLASVSLSALPLGNPWEASFHTDGVFCSTAYANIGDPCASWCDSYNFRIGFYGDYIFNRHMKVRARDKAIRRTEVFTNAAYLVLNLWDRLDLTTTLGATSIYFVSPDHTFSSIFDPLFNNTTDLMTNTSFSYSSGVRFTLWECGCFALGAEGQYFYTRPKINYTHSNDFSVRYAGKGQHLKYYDWQIGLGSAYRIDIIQRSTAFIPYVGVRWNRARINPGDVRVVLPSDIFLNQREQRQWGYAVGATFLGCNKISVTAEGRFANENAFYVNSQFRF